MIKQYKKDLKKQQGLALITVLLVVALVTIIGTEMAIRLQMQITRSSNLQSNEQAFWYALGAEEFGKLIIKESMDADKGVIHLEQAWAMEGMVFPVEEGEIGGQISDLHSCFNLNSVYQKAKKGDQRETQAIRGRSNQNSLINRNQNTKGQFDTKPKKQFAALLEALNVESYDSERISDSLYDWLDPDSNTSPYGAEDYTYEARPQAHLAANSPMVDESELRVIEGMNRKLLDKLMPFICIIPSNTEMVLNVNTVKEDQSELLHAMLAPKLTLAAAKSIIANRPKNGFKSIDDFWQSTEIVALGKISKNVKAQFTVQSKHFKMQSKTEFNRSWIDLKSIFQINEKGKLTVIAREIGV